MSEDRESLLRGMPDLLTEWERDRRVVRRCVCRSFVGVEERPTPDAVAYAVLHHQSTPPHLLWSDRGGMEAELDRHDEGTFPVRVRSVLEKRRAS